MELDLGLRVLSFRALSILALASHCYVLISAPGRYLKLCKFLLHFGEQECTCKRQTSNLRP